MTRLLETEYHLDAEELKAYFPLERVLQGIFGISRILFGITFREAAMPVWHPEVRTFELHGPEGLVARLYLDLFPRKHKYGHAACFGISGGSETGAGYRKPSAALVCNFPPPTSSQPSLLTHDNVVTLFHEFGHVLHHLLTHAALYSQSGTHVATDFVEVPSQLFENWAWEYESLKRFALHYKTGEVLPESLFEKMIAARNADSGLHIAQQLFYGTLDMTFHDRYDPTTTGTTEVVRRVQGEVSPYPYLEGTHMETSFGHLNGYAAGYYSYLWSRVYADDMYSAFRKKGVLNGETGRRLNEQVFSMGSSRDEGELIRTFLGREPDQRAFMALNDLNPVSDS
jgi:thimet oligopeptidase